MQSGTVSVLDFCCNDQALRFAAEPNGGLAITTRTARACGSPIAAATNCAFSMPAILAQFGADRDRKNFDPRRDQPRSGTTAITSNLGDERSGYSMLATRKRKRDQNKAGPLIPNK